MSHPYLPAVIDLVRQAGRATLPFWRCATAVTAKAGDSGAFRGGRGHCLE